MLNRKSIIAFTIGIFTSAIPAYAEFSQESPIYDSGAFSVQQELFEFSDEGNLVNGPRRGSGQPIDYSSIIKEVYLKGGFIDSVTGCAPGIDHCGFIVRKFPSKGLDVEIVSEELGINDDQHFQNRALDTCERTLGKLGFELDVSNNSDPASIVLISGTEEFLRNQAQQRLDSLATRAIDSWKDEKDIFWLAARLFSKGTSVPFCYVSSANWLIKSQIEIYVDVESDADCLPRAYFTAIGFYPTLFETPSIGNLSSRYTSPTFADRLYVEILYNQDFPLDLGVDAIQAYWPQNAIEAWRALVAYETSGEWP